MTAPSRRSLATRLLNSASLISSTAIATLIFAAPHSARALDANALPTGGTVVGGSATINQSASNKLDVNQSSERTVINWDSFNIGKNATTQFYQPNANALAVNRVTGAGEDPAKIEGELIANGKVMVIDRNGVIFGKGSMINVNGIIASTGDVSDQAIMNGDTKFDITNFGNGKIVNNGTINVGEAGLAAFVSPTIVNNGTINARLGRVAFGAGSKVTLDLNGDNLISIAVNDKAANAIIKQNGVIRAEGGTVELTAEAAKSAVDNVINMDGVIDVSSIQQKGGTIVLSGGEQGTVNVAGTLDTSGRGGGSIGVTGQNNKIAKTAVLKADARGTGNGGEIDVIGSDSVAFEGLLSSRGGDNGGNGGSGEISAPDVGFEGLVDFGAADGAVGSLILDPDLVVIHSGILDLEAGPDYMVSAQALANSLRNTNIALSAKEFIDVGTAPGGYDIDTGHPVADALLNATLNGLGDGSIDLSQYDYLSGSLFHPTEHTGLTTGTLTLTAPIVDINRTVTLGSGGLDINAGTLDLGATIYTRGAYGATPTIVTSDAQLNLSQAATINVLSDDASIGEAILFADAGTSDLTGTTINVAAGTYDEDLTLDKAFVTLSGAGKGGTVLTPHSPGVVVTANNDTVEGFVINGATDGILVENASGVKILDNEILNSSLNAINFTGSANGEIASNLLFNTGSDGIHISGSADIDIANNAVGTLGGAGNIRGNGIFVTGSNNATLTGNTITQTHSTAYDVGSGIYVTDSANAIIGGATAALGNTISNVAWDDVKLVDTTDATVQDNILSSPARTNVYALDSSGTQVLGNTASGARLAGEGAIWINGGIDATISSNKVSDAIADGILLNSVTGTNLVSGNIVDSASGSNTVGGIGSYGIAAFGITGLTISKNIVNDTGNDGVYVETSNGVDILNNTIGFSQSGKPQSRSIKGNGIDVVSSNGATIQSNLVGQTHSTGYDIGSGIYILDSNNVMVGGAAAGQGNTVANVQWDDIKFVGTVNGSAIGNTLSSPVRVNIYALDTTNTKVSNNTISGAMLADEGAIWIDGGSNSTVSGNKISDAINDGILLDDVTGRNYVSGNNLYSNTAGIGGYGIAAFDTAGLTISGNLVNATGSDGIHVEDSIDAEILNNTLGFTQSGDPLAGSIKGNGIFVTGSNGAAIQGNLIGQTVSTGYDIGSGIYITASKGVMIGGTSAALGNTVSDTGWDDVKVTYSNNVTVEHNTLSSPARVNIYALDTGGTKILNNTVSGAMLANEGAIWVNEGYNSTVSGNKISDAINDGILLDDVTGTNLVSANDLYSPTGSNTVGIIGGYGIAAFDTAGLTVSGNLVNSTGSDGIHVEDSAGAKILNNTLGFTQYGKPLARSIRGNGIDIVDSNGAIIQGNLIGQTHSSGYDIGSGIYVIGSNDVTVGGTGAGQGNTVKNVQWDGIKLVDTSGASVTDNTVDGAVRVALYGEDTDGTTATGNTFTDTNLNTRGQIWLNGGSNATVEDNTLSDAALHGIELDGLSGSNLIESNKLLGGFGGDGIHVTDTQGLTISGNSVNGAAGDGIFVDPSPSATISGNNVTNAGADGIYAEDEDGLTITDNTVDGSAYNGIEVNGGSDIAVTDNGVTHSGYDGIYVHDVGEEVFTSYALAKDLAEVPVADVVITGNTVDFAGGNGIEVGNVDSSFIDSNKVGTAGAGEDGNIGGDGIVVYDEGNEEADVVALDISPFGNNGDTTITNNVVANTGDNGIEVDNLATADIETNTVDSTGVDGIYAFGIGGGEIFLLTKNDSPAIPDADLTISNNFIGQNGFISGNGITVYDSGPTTIADNTIGVASAPVLPINELFARDVVGNNDVGGVGGNGIDVEDNFDDVTITGNHVTGAQGNGIYLSDADSIEVSSNIITGSGAIGLFAAGSSNGYVALSGNTFNDNPTGARFESGTIDLTGDANTFNGGDTALQFDPGVDGDPADLVLVGDAGFPGGTIGTTVFNGQTTNYVQFANGAFFAPGNPTIIDGLNASYDGFVPATTGGVENNAQYDAIENMVFHFNDDPTLGLLFFGFVPTDVTADLSGLINQGDIYERISGYQVGPHAFRVTVRGLPLTGYGNGNRGGAGGGETGGNSLGTSAELLANVQPAAGGSQSQANQAAALEPAAGESSRGKTSACWSQTVSNAAAGITTSFTFGGTPEANLSGIASCGS